MSRIAVIGAGVDELCGVVWGVSPEGESMTATTGE
jgi:hypothetical protein